MPVFHEPSIPFSEQRSPARGHIGKAVATRLEATQGVRRVPVDNAQIYLAENFLSPAECAMLIGLIDAGCAPSTLFVKHDGFRTSESCNLDRWDPRVLKIDTRVALLLGIDPRHGETIQGQRYAVGQQFKPHPDFFYVDQPYWADMEKCGGQRTWTAMVYLNVPDRGGATTFPHLQVAVHPRVGMILIWNNMADDGAPNPWTLHEGSPVSSGTKYVITKWFRERPWI